MDKLPRFLETLWTEKVVVRNLMASALLIVAIVAARAATLRSLRRLKWASLQGGLLRLNAQLRWAAVGVTLMGLVVIWASELRTLALSLVAIAAAIAIATKELIMCLSGALVRAGSQSFEIGDRIEVDGARGDVIDHQLLTTTILEIGVGHRPTGRTVIIPNSVFLTHKVFNETLSDEYVLHTIAVPVDLTGNIQDIQRRLLDIATTICGPFLAHAERSLDATASSHGLRSFSVAPRIVVQLTEPGKARLLLHVPTPARERGEIEQMILQRLLQDGPQRETQGP